jgi:hypothetical protein
VTVTTAKPVITFNHVNEALAWRLLFRTERRTVLFEELRRQITIPDGYCEPFNFQGVANHEIDLAAAAFLKEQIE